MANWAVQETYGAIVPHRRVLRNLALISERLAQNSGVSFSAATGHGGRQAASRLFSKAQTSVSGLLQGHYDQTCFRCGDHDLVLAAQDTTILNYTSHEATQGLGPINDREQARGLHAHSALVMTPNGAPLGVAYLDIWARAVERKGSAADRKIKPIEEKESYKWLQGLQGIEQSLADHLNAGKRVLVIGDREADIFELIAAPRHTGTDLLIRAAHPRRVEVEGYAGSVNLFEAVAQAQVLGDCTVQIPRKGKSPEREATLELRSQAVTMRAPAYGAKRSVTKPQTVWVVQASERSEGASQRSQTDKGAVSWTLITTLQIETAAEAKQLVEYYTRRWMIERLHLTLKSGLQIERLQFDDTHSLSNALAVCWIVAWRIMSLTYTARASPSEPARNALEEDEIAVLEQMGGRSVATVQQAVIAIAKLAGYLPSPKALPPGLKVMWTGMRKLEAMVEFYKEIKHRIS